MKAPRPIATPRRLALTVQGLPARQPDTSEERKGSARRRARGRRPGLPQGGRARLARRRRGSRATRRRASSMSPSIEKPGRPVPDLVAEIVPEIVQDLPVAEIDALGLRNRCAGCARSTRSSAPSGRETEDARGRARSRSTASQRRRRHARAIASWRPAAFRVRRFEDYVAQLEGAKVVLDPARRRDDHPDTTPATLAVAQSGSTSSRTRRCSTRRRASSNGRSC